VEATSAFEAMEKMVQERKLSKKINYDVLKDLNPSAFKADAVEFTQVKIIIILTIIIIITFIYFQINWLCVYSYADSWWCMPQAGSW